MITLYLFASLVVIGIGVLAFVIAFLEGRATTKSTFDVVALTLLSLIFLCGIVAILMHFGYVVKI